MLLQQKSRAMVRHSGVARALLLVLAVVSSHQSLPTAQARLPDDVSGGLLAMLAVLLVLGLMVFPMLSPLLLYWRILFFFWFGGRYADAKTRFGLSGMSSGHLYSLAMVPWLMTKPHYRTGTFKEDMLTNLRNVVLPTGIYGVPLSLWAYSRLHALVAILFVIPFAAFVGSWYRRIFGLDFAYACFRRSLLEPRDWFQLWRLNCRLASMTALATKSPDFDMESKWNFIKGCLDNGLPTTPALETPKILVAKDVNEEGGMGIHVLPNVLYGGAWLLQEKLDNHPDVQQLLPKDSPLSTMRVVTGSYGALALLGRPAETKKLCNALCAVWRAGRAGASTDHSCVMVDVPQPRGEQTLGTGSSSAHWYAQGFKSLGKPLSTADGSIAHHPDTELSLCGCKLPKVKEALELCERSHEILIPSVPLAGWDVAFVAEEDPKAPAKLVLLEANLSCNFFRGTVNWEERKVSTSSLMTS
ncbi:unnamed protein product [Durusdinium trenchii]|uniref:Uncharacterized protein n=1 Tax=Durusdinium trenchii TaxID=1381693 RepID=A0ABP0M686_9DINO